MTPRVTPEMIEQLAQLARLPLARERRDALAEDFAGMFAEASLVNRFMEQRRAVQPGVRFHHVELEERWR